MFPGPTEMIAPGDIKLEFDFEGVPVTIVSHKGSFQFAERLDIPERGCLDRGQHRGVADFEINLYVAWINDASFYEKIKDAKKFDLTVTIDDQRYVLEDAIWINVVYVPGSTEFCLSGVVNNVGT